MTKRQFDTSKHVHDEMSASVKKWHQWLEERILHDVYGCTAKPCEICAAYERASKYCSECGKPFDEGAAVTETAEAAEDEEPPSRTYTKDEAQMEYTKLLNRVIDEVVDKARRSHESEEPPRPKDGD